MRRAGGPALSVASAGHPGCERRGGRALRLEEMPLALFVTSNTLRILAYIPQMRKAATDGNGASAISYTTWSLFLAANLSTVAYAIVNRADWGLAVCFCGNALC